METIPDGSVLDVGAAGLEGDNTTNYLTTRFQDYTGICIRPEKVEAYKNPNIIVGDFYTTEFDRKFDIIVLDLNIDNNLRDWSDEQLKKMWKLLTPGGYLVNYVMLTTNYGDPETPQLIASHAKSFWGNLTVRAVISKQYKGFELYDYAVEQRRPEILWVALKRTDG